jgi:hypothetical protein
MEVVGLRCAGCVALLKLAPSLSDSVNGRAGQEPGAKTGIGRYDEEQYRDDVA